VAAFFPAKVVRNEEVDYRLDIGPSRGFYNIFCGQNIHPRKISSSQKNPL